MLASRHLLAATILAVAVLGTLAACVTHADFDDATPPTLELRYRFDDGEWIKIDHHGARIESFDGSELRLWAVGQDTKGVRKVTIFAAGKTVCQKGLGRYTETISEAKSAEEDASVGDGDRTEATRNVLLTLTPCKGVDLRSADFSIYAKVENFAGLTSTSSTIDVVVEP